MKINYFSNQISFNSIQLSQYEKAKSDLILSQFNSNSYNKDCLKLELLDIFEKHIEKESDTKAKGIYYKEDFSQKMYLKLFEILNEAENITTEMIVKTLNAILPANEELKENHRLGIKSINKNINNDIEKPLETILTEDNLPKLSSTVSEEEREKKLNIINKLGLDSNLSQEELEILNSRASGKTYKEIAKENNVRIATIWNKFSKAITKIQNCKNILPEEYDNISQMLLGKYSLSITKEELKKILIKNPYIFKLSENKISQIIEQAANLLNIPPESYVKAALKHIALLWQTPELTINNVDKTCELLDIEKDKYIQAALKQPTILSLRPDTVNSNVNKVAELLNIDKKTIIEIAYKYPGILYQKADTTFKKVCDTAKLLEIDTNTFIQCAIKHPALFSIAPKTIIENITKSAEMLNLDKKSYIKAALKRPSLFYQKPETIVNNIKKTSEYLNIDKNYFAKAALKQPQLFYQKPETLLDNATKAAKLIGMDLHSFIQVAIKQPQIFYQNPESIASNLNKAAKLLNLSLNDYISIVLKQPVLFYQKPENVEKKIKILKYYKEIQGKKTDTFYYPTNSNDILYEKILNYLVKISDKLKNAIDEKNFINYLKEKNKTYNFIIPTNELTKDLILFAQEFSMKNFGKQIFSFKII